MSAQNPKIITANRLTDGAVVFLAKPGVEASASDYQWTENVDQSLLLHDDIAVQRAEEKAAEYESVQFVIGSYAIEVTTCAGSDVRPVRFKERIRAYGPSTHPEFGRGDHPSHYQDGGTYQSPLYMSGL